MGIPLFRHSVIPSLIGALMVALSSCNQAPPTSAKKEPTLTITSQQNSFRKGDNLDATLKIYSPTDTDVSIIIGASDKLGLAQNNFQISLSAGQTKTIELLGKIKRAGYYNITANAISNSWHEPVATMFGFNAQTNDVQRAATETNYPQTASSAESLETHLDNLPKFTTPEAYSQLSTAQAIDDAKDQDRVRLDARLENVQFDKRDGTKSEPFNTVLTYLPDTGSGQPRPEDLVPPTAAQKAKAKPRGIGCGASSIATVTATITYNGKTQILPYTKIAVGDENPWLNPSLVASGYTDANGQFRFAKPDCDWGAWWDYSGPDLFFSIESLDNHEIGTWNILAPIYNSTYGVRTGIYWDTTSTNFSANLNANNSDSEHAIWLYRMVQMAQDFNVGAGGAGATYFPIRIAWPTRLNPINWFGVVTLSFALVSKLEIEGGAWIYPYIAWHEFGHNMMYRTSNPSGYSWAYNLGAFAAAVPSFAWGTHYIDMQENPELAYNEGFSSYLYVMLQDYYNMDFNYWNNSKFTDTYYFRNCSTVSCTAYPVGNENESRVSTFLYRYTNESLVTLSNTFNGVNPQKAFGLVRSTLWNIGYYNTNFTNAWNNRIKTTLPSSSSTQNAVKKIANDTFFSLAGLP